MTSTRVATKTPKSARDTPAMRQYFGFKQEHPNCVLFFRMGDFYELFDEDARIAARELGLTLTERTKGLAMAGVPHQTLEQYAQRMVSSGYHVAICDQVQDPKDAKGVVDRAVTRVLTPGTLVDDAMLDESASNILAGAIIEEQDCALALVECSTGEFQLVRCALRDLTDELARAGVSELIAPELATGEIHASLGTAARDAGCALTPRPSWQFGADECVRSLCRQFGVSSLSGFGLSEEDGLARAAGAVVRYLLETQRPDSTESRGVLGHLQIPRVQASDDRLVLDATSLRALEIEQTIRGASQEGSLLGVFLEHGGRRTPMGKRLLRAWLKNPSVDTNEIRARQRCVTSLLDDRRFARDIAEHTERIQDVSRIVGRLGLGRATPRDVVALGHSLSRLDGLIEVLASAPSFEATISSLRALCAELTPLSEEILRMCVENPPAHLREGGLLADGVDRELDEARGLERDASSWLTTYQAQLAETHELPNLKVGYNKVFGYYIELPAAQARRAPDEFTRKQTLKNAERYITPELKEFEEKVLSATERAISREQVLFASLCDRCVDCANALGEFGRVIARVDVLLCFAQVGDRKGWIVPEVVEEPIVRIVDGRHPVLDDLLGDDFVPNDTELATPESGALSLITGPNMSGKSTYIRQIAILTLLAHTGSCVPASSATIGLCDRIFTRVGADDALHAGQSTFMVEMIETANILHHCTDRSLVVLDEIGRGTSTLDGLALAWAIVERLAGNGEHRAPRTVFATHYHELTSLEDELDGRVRNLHVAVREWGDEVVFLHRIQSGRADRSYGIHVARLAGVPRKTVERAQSLLESLAVSHESSHIGSDRSPRQEHAQPGLFSSVGTHPLVELLASLEIESMSPLEVFDRVRTMRDQARDELA
ncbi:MAG: DNA mismatch repair protein MutS [Phycisphaerales bacterium JB043]